MAGHCGRSLAASVMASSAWSKWPWLTSRRSQRSTSCGDFGERGLLNQGSSRMRVPRDVVISQHECPYQVIETPEGRPMRLHLLSLPGWGRGSDAS
jgi:hypothetical protein